MRRIISIFIFAFMLLAVHQQVEAQVLTVSQQEIGQYVELSIDLDTLGFDVTVIDASIDLAGVQEAEIVTTASLLHNWIEQPELIGKEVNFSGIFPNSFQGVGNLLTLVIPVHEAENLQNITASGSVIKYKGDAAEYPLSIKFVDIVASEELIIEPQIDTVDLDPPVVTVLEIVNNETTEGNSIVVFDVSDPASGVAGVDIYDGGIWYENVQSPYIVKNSNMKEISIRVRDRTGNSVIESIENNYATCYLIWGKCWYKFGGAVAVVIAIILFHFYFHRRYRDNRLS